MKALRKVSVEIEVFSGSLDLGEGLLSLIRPALLRQEEGASLTIRSLREDLEEDLKRWCQVQHHSYLGSLSDGKETLYKIQRGPYPAFSKSKPLGETAPPIKFGEFSTESYVKTEPFPEQAPEASGFSPRGSLLEKGSPSTFFPFSDKASAVPDEVASLYDQAIKNQWRADKDIEWAKIRPLPDFLEEALSQVLNFLAENELSALYVPSRFLSQIHPHFVETAMFIATQLADEARHAEVFLKRARLFAKSAPISAAVTSKSLLSLMETQDLFESTFLLSVLGEGTFIDLLSYLEEHAPDPVTKDIFVKSKRDETRHVHFGMAHVRKAIKEDPSLKATLRAAVEKRAASLASLSGAPEALQDALTLLAAKSQDPEAIRNGAEQYRKLLETMELNRVKRLQSVGFSESEAKEISSLHTPNFM